MKNLRKLRKRLRKKLRHLTLNIFIGRHSTTIVVGFMVGATILARSLWQFLYEHLGLGRTALVGFLIFFLSGWYMHQFYDESEEE